MARHSRPLRATLAAGVLLLSALGSLAWPVSALADNCTLTSPDEINVKQCLERYPLATLGLLGAALGALGIAIWAASKAAGAAADAIDRSDREIADAETFRHIDEAISRNSAGRPSSKPPSGGTGGRK